MSSREDLVGTSDLMLWFGMSKWAVARALKKAGIEPVRRGAHGQAMWPRLAALDTLTRKVVDQRKGGALL